MTVKITQQDKAVLTLCSKKEAKSYNTVYGGGEVNLVEKTVAEVMIWQDDILKQRRNWSSAVGKYQMLKEIVKEESEKFKLDSTQTRYTADVQDAMMIKRLTRYRKYAQFKSKSLGGSERENAEKFCIELAKEFASIPVPYDMTGHKGRSVRKGQSYYAGDGTNKAHHNPDTFVQELIDIRTNGAGADIKTVETDNGSVVGSNASSPTGESPRAQMENFATGGGTHDGRRVTGNNTTAQRQANGLPTPENVYVYEVIDPLDDRYDFRTGKKVTDITLYGTSSVAAYNQANSDNAANTPASQAGVASAEGVKDLDNQSIEELRELMGSRDRVATQPGRYSDVFSDPYDPAQLLSIPGRLPPAPIPGSAPVRSIPRDGLSGKPEQNKTLPEPSILTGAAVAAGALAIQKSLQPNQETSKPTQEQTQKRDFTVKLQQDLNKAKRDIASLIRSMNQIVEGQGEIYGNQLRAELTSAQTTLTNAKATLAAAQAGGNPNTIKQAEAAVFSAQARVTNLQSKLNLGNPYGLTTSEKQRRAREDSRYIQYQSDLTVLVQNTVPNIVSQARSLGIDLTQSKMTAQLTAVPPIVKFE